MKEYDIVEVTVEKEKYVKEGVHKGMQGVILDPRNIDGCWLVFFSNPETGADEIGVAVKEVDLKLIYDSKREEERESNLQVEIKNDNYAAQGIRKGMRGVIRDLSSRDDKYAVCFDDDKQVLISRVDFFAVYNK